MTKKHFEAIAAVLAEYNRVKCYNPHISNLENDFADMCEAQNPRFDRDRFLRACRGEK